MFMTCLTYDILNRSDTSEDPPLRHWNIKIVLEGPGKEEVPAAIFSNAQYRLHETFGDRMIQGTGSIYSENYVKLND